jgi:recombination protein RecA
MVEPKLEKKLKNLITPANDWKDDPNDFESTGIISLDIGLVKGGFRKGRFVEGYGEEHTGKTLSTMLAIAWNQKKKEERSLFIDAEGSIDISWFKNMGGNLGLLDIYDPFKTKTVCGEEVFNNSLDLIETGRYRFAVIDSLMGAALLSQELKKKDLGDTERMGAQAKLNKAFFQRAFIICKQTDTILLVTNHLMESMGIKWGNPETTPGGKLLKMYAEQRLKYQNPNSKASAKTELGHKVRIKIIKNKRGASAGKEVDFWLDYYRGVDNYKEMGELMRKKGLIGKKEVDDFIKTVRTDEKLYDLSRLQLIENAQKEIQDRVEEVEDDIEVTDDFEETTD